MMTKLAVLNACVPTLIHRRNGDCHYYGFQYFDWKILANIVSKTVHVTRKHGRIKVLRKREYCPTKLGPVVRN